MLVNGCQAVWIFFHERNTQQRLNPCRERGIWVWSIPNQKLPTCQQGLLKYTPKTGQLKLAERQSRVSCKSQASKCSREQSEKKSSPWELVSWSYVELSCKMISRAVKETSSFCIIVLALCRALAQIFSPSPHKPDRKGLKMLKIVWLLALVNMIYHLTTGSVWLRLKYSKVFRERMAFYDSQKTFYLFS